MCCSQMVLGHYHGHHQLGHLVVFLGTGTAGVLAKFINSNQVGDSSILTDATTVYPDTNGVINLGTTGNAFNNIYSSGTVFDNSVEYETESRGIVSSDLNTTVLYNVGNYTLDTFDGFGDIKIKKL